MDQSEGPWLSLAWPRGTGGLSFLHFTPVGSGWIPSAASTHLWWFHHQSHVDASVRMTGGRLPSPALGLSLPVYLWPWFSLPSPGIRIVKGFTSPSLPPRLLPGGEAPRRSVWDLESAAGSILGLGPKPQAAQMCKLPGSSAKLIPMEPQMQVCPCFPVLPKPGRGYSCTRGQLPSLRKPEEAWPEWSQWERWEGSSCCG